MHCLQVICPRALAKKNKAWLIGQAFFMGLAREPGLYGLGAWILS